MATADNSHLRRLGSQFGEYVSRQKGNVPSPAALQGVIADLAAGESELIAPLRDLVSKQSFTALLPYARSNGGLIQRDALIQEISRVYHPDVLVRVEEVLNGFLDASGGIATSLMQDQSSVQPEKAVITNEVSPLDRMISEKAKHVTSGQQTHPVVDKSRTASSSDRTHPIVAVAIFGVTAIAAAGVYLSMNPGVSCPEIADKLEPLASDEPEFKKLVSENKEACSDDARFLVLQGYMLNDQNDHSQALQLINKSLKIQPDNAVAYKVRGNAYFGLKDYNNSLSAFSRSLQLDPKDTWAAYGKGNALSWLDRVSEAASFYTEAIKLDPSNAAAYRERGNERMRLKEYNNSIADLNKSIQLDGSNETSYQLRAFTKTWLDDFAGACTDIKKAKQLGLKEVQVEGKMSPIDTQIKEICAAQ
ncbi:tetratricopeptide repeat protein [Synechococcus lacustris C3-12m-Tous]|uniref:tetratricopeptide repeat protein n=1 Tax=Synechococcus lacustris TaxID=2116544 RepID=UPI0020CBDC99|nr:tetratricopeptide repeat protein [Synechococcus lacustris]MCP9926175.1 tetratricopeptide repeat protein [Synechococcus lacustris C3-12m-Tous]